MQLSNSLLQHPISPCICRSLNPWGDPRACLGASLLRLPKKEGKKVQLQELQFSIGLPLALAPLCLQELSLNPNPTFTKIQSRWAALPPLFTRCVPAWFKSCMGSTPRAEACCHCGFWGLADVGDSSVLSHTAPHLRRGAASGRCTCTS